MLSFTTRVAERIFVVSSRRFLTSSLAARGHGRERVAELADVAGLVGRDAERVGQRVGPQQLVGLWVLALLLGVGLGLGDVRDLADVRRVLRERPAHALDRGVVGVRLEEDVHQDLSPDLVGGAGRRLHHRDEDAEHEHRHEHRGHRRERGHGVAPQRAGRLAQEERDAHG
jgi:hypothetical protein